MHRLEGIPTACSLSQIQDMEHMHCGAKEACVPALGAGRCPTLQVGRKSRTRCGGATGSGTRVLRLAWSAAHPVVQDKGTGHWRFERGGMDTLGVLPLAWSAAHFAVQKKVYQAQGRRVFYKAGLLAVERSCSTCSTDGGLQGTGHGGLGRGAAAGSGARALPQAGSAAQPAVQDEGTGHRA